MITVALVGAQTPPLVQIVVDSTPPGEAWIVEGSADGMTWVVPGATGVGDGNQLTLIDNRGPLNVPITYTFRAESVTEEAAEITLAVPSTIDAVLQTLDGQRSVGVTLLDPSLDYELDVFQSVFGIPGRRTPAVRYTQTGLGGGTLVIRVARDEAVAFDSVVESGAPILIRHTSEAFDLPRVAVILLNRLPSTALFVAGLRDWQAPYRYVDDPYLDRRLGAFTWTFFDGVWNTLPWDDFDTAMDGLSWNEFDTLDWTTL